MTAHLIRPGTTRRMDMSGFNSYRVHPCHDPRVITRDGERCTYVYPEGHSRAGDTCNAILREGNERGQCDCHNQQPVTVSDWALTLYESDPTEASANTLAAVMLGHKPTPKVEAPKRSHRPKKAELSKEVQRQIVVWFYANVPTCTICKRVHCGPATLQDFIAKHGLTRPKLSTRGGLVPGSNKGHCRRLLTDEQKDLVQTLSEAGYTRKEAKTEAGVSWDALYAATNERGLKWTNEGSSK